MKEHTQAREVKVREGYRVTSVYDHTGTWVTTGYAVVDCVDVLLPETFRYPYSFVELINEFGNTVYHELPSESVHWLAYVNPSEREASFVDFYE